MNGGGRRWSRCWVVLGCLGWCGAMTPLNASAGAISREQPQPSPSPAREGGMGTGHVTPAQRPAAQPDGVLAATTSSTRTRPHQRSTGPLLLKPAGTNPPRTNRAPLGWAAAPRLFSRLAIVLGVFLGWVLLQRLLTGHSVRPLPSEIVQVYGRVPLNSRQHLQLVRVGARLLVLVESPQGLQRLAEISDPDEVQRLIGQLQPQSPLRLQTALQPWLRQLKSLDTPRPA